MVHVFHKTKRNETTDMKATEFNAYFTSAVRALHTK